jgi:glycosyltransferase involved in cell wall biosynthesis
MRILIAHNQYLFRGGEDECVEAEAALLRDNGHVVDECILDNSAVATLGSARVAARTTWSMPAYRDMRTRIRAFRPDIVHVHNFFPLLSPALHYAAAVEHVPSVQTLHNYRLACLNGYFFRDGHVCEDCTHTAVPWPGVVHGCYRRSRMASAAVAGMLTTHRLLGTWQQKVSAFIALTDFARQKFIDIGLPADKLHIKPNFVVDTGVGDGQGGYALFVGRLSPEKGLNILIEAWRDAALPPLKIIGDGPLAEPVKAAAQANANIAYLGSRPLAEVLRMIGNAEMLVVPSRWYETFGRTVVEAFSKGTAVVASRLGAVASLIDDRRTGLLVEPNNPVDLGEAVKRLHRDGALRQTLRSEARAEYMKSYTPDRSYRMTMGIYDRMKIEMTLKPARAASSTSTHI